MKFVSIPLFASPALQIIDMKSEISYINYHRTDHNNNLQNNYCTLTLTFALHLEVDKE